MAGAAVVISANPLQLDIRSHEKCLWICLVVTTATFQFGLDYALLGGFMAMPGFLRVFGYFDANTSKWAIDPTVQQLISSLLTLGQLVGNLLVGPFSSRFGRRHGLWAASGLNFISTAIMIGTTSIKVLYFARFLLGVSIGWFFTFSVVYVNEVSPAHLRGIVFSLYQFQLSLGSIIGAVIDNATHLIEGKEAYRIPLAIFFAAPTIQTIAMFFFPESPRWLMTQGREDEARSALQSLRNSNIDQKEFEAEFNEIRISTKEQTEQNGKHLWMEIWNDRNRRRTLLSIAIICTHSAAGNYLTIYTTYFLTVAGVDKPFAMGVMTTVIGMLGGIASFFVVRRLDRRAMVMIGSIVVALSHLGMAVAWTAAPGSAAAGKCTVAFICTFIFAYVAYAPASYLLGGEYPNNHLRAYTFGLGISINGVFTWLAIFTAPYFINPASLGWSAKYGFIWFGSNIVVLVFTWFYIPETRDRTLEEIHEMFEANLPASKFKGYVCTSTQAMADVVQRVTVVKRDGDGEKSDEGKGPVNSVRGVDGNDGSSVE